MEPPDVRYARSGDVAIAYQVVGDAPIDRVFVRGFAGDLLSAWEQPMLVRFIEELAVAGPGEILVSSTVKDLVAGSGIAFVERGDHALKGIPGHWKLYAIAQSD